MPKRRGANNEDFKKWDERITVAKQKRDRRKDEWQQHFDMYKGKDSAFKWSRNARTMDHFRVNLVRSTVSKIRDVIYAKNPRFNASMLTPGAQLINGGVINARQVEETTDLISHLLDRFAIILNLKKSAKLAVVDALLGPWGVLKVYHESQTITDAEDQERISQERYVIRRIHPFNFIIDANAEQFDLQYMNWVAEEKLLRPDVAKEAYREAPGKDVRQDEIESNVEVDRATDKVGDKKTDEMVQVYEIHDREGGELLEIMPGTGILRREPHPYEVTRRNEGFIYSAFTLGDDDPDGPFPVAYVDRIAGSTNVISNFLTYFLNHVGYSAKRILAVPKGKYDDLDAITDGNDGDVVEYRVDDGAPDTVIPAPEIPPDVWNAFQTVFGPVMRELSGLDEFLRGSTQPGTSPTEAQLISQGTGVGFNSLTDTLQDALSRVGQILLTEIQQFSDEREVIEYVGEKGTEWIEFSNEDIAGNFNVQVEHYSSTPFQSGFELQRAREALAELYGRPEVDNVELVSAVVEKMGLPDRIVRKGARQGPQDPQFEHYLVSEGIQLRVDPTEDHVDHIIKHTAYVEFLAAIPGPDEQSTLQIQNLSAHIDQHRQMLQAIQQQTQLANAQVGQQAPQTNQAQPQQLSQQQQLAAQQGGQRPV